MNPDRDHLLDGLAVVIAVVVATALAVTLTVGSNGDSKKVPAVAEYLYDEDESGYSIRCTHPDGCGVTELRVVEHGLEIVEYHLEHGETRAFDDETSVTVEPASDG